MEASTTTDPIITLTPSGAEEVKSILTQPDNAGKTMRIYVEQGGCSGCNIR
jgi:Fe-S cluster assembly iron-binding protein IscA